MKEINEDNIRIAAYYIWEQAGRPEGAEKECWIKACEQLFAAKPEKTTAKKTSAKSVEKSAKASADKPAAKKTSSKKPAAKPAASAPVFYGVKKK